MSVLIVKLWIKPPCFLICFQVFFPPSDLITNNFIFAENKWPFCVCKPHFDVEILIHLKMALPFSICWLWGKVSLNINPTMCLIWHLMPWLTHSRCSIVTERRNHIFYIKFHELFKSLPEENRLRRHKVTLPEKTIYQKFWKCTNKTNDLLFMAGISNHIKHNVRKIPD